MPGRIRTLKPELLEDEKTAGLPDDAFRLFVSLILLADDYGNARANAIWLKGQVWWCLEHSGDIPEMLRRLSGVSLITVYEVNGQSYLHVNGWEKHQKISHKGKPRIPSIKESIQKHSGDRPDDFRPDLRPHTTDRERRCAPARRYNSRRTKRTGSANRATMRNGVATGIATSLASGRTGTRG